MKSENLSKGPLEPDLIIEGGKVIYMSDSEQARRVVAGLLPLFEYFFAQFRGGAL